MEVTTYGFISTIPILVLIIGVIITKKMAEMLLLSTFVGALIIYKTGFFSGYVGLLYETMSGDMFQFLFLILVFCGPLIVLFEKSGALLGFSRIVSKLAKTQKRAMFITWALSFVIFIDDYLHALSISSAMKKTTDQLGIPREHLAYAVNATGACVCVLIPFTSWAAFAIGCMKEFDLGFNDYLSAIPFMFYPIASVLLSLLVGIGIVPKVGPIKKAYKRVADGGPVTIPPDASGATAIVSVESDEEVKASSPWNFIIPIVLLIVSMIYFDNDLIHGLIVALICQLIMYLPQRIMKPTEFMNAFLQGVTSMANLIFIVLIAFTLACVNNHLGFSNYMITVFTQFITPALLPAITFLLCAAIAFTSGSFWALIVIATPVFVPLAQSVGIPPSILIGGIMSGTALGSQSCFYSDAVFMTAAGTGVSNVPQVRAVAPYVITGVVLSTIAFLIMGFVFV